MDKGKRIYRDEDTQLLMKAIEGDKEACNKLYKKYFSVVVCFIASLNGDFHLSEDITQKIFSRILNKEIEFRGDSSVKTFLLSVAKYILSEHNRQESKEFTVRRMWVSKQDITSQSKPEYDAAEVIQNVNKAMVHLSQKQRQAIELIYNMELPPRKAAQIADCTEKAFECRLGRAYKKLRQIIHNSEI